MQIGKVTIDGPAMLAPMAGVTDRAFRRICFDYGAAGVVGEMVSAKGLVYGDRKSEELLCLEEDVRPAAIQLFGSEPEILAQAALRVMAYKPDWIDINMGCPAPKIVGNHSGSALMKDPDLCAAIVRAVKEAVPVPVTVKIRKGYDAGHSNAVAVALACEAAGADAITVHGRTREQMYAPPVDWDVIRQVKEGVRIPVIGNGDVTDARSAAALYEQTGCDGIMVGRGALGAPWIFSQINAYVNKGVLLPDPPISRRMETLMKQTQRAIECKGEKLAILQARKHAAWYISGWPGAAAFRRDAGKIATWEDLAQLCRRVVEASER